MAPIGLPASGAVVGSEGIESPLSVQFAITPTGAADGGFDVSWGVVLKNPSRTSPLGTLISGGALRMLPGDSLAKLLYQIRGAYLAALQSLTLQQLLPTQPDSTVSPTSGSYIFSIPVDLIAALPSNPRNAGQ